MTLPLRLQPESFPKPNDQTLANQFLGLKFATPVFRLGLSPFPIFLVVANEVSDGIFMDFPY